MTPAEGRRRDELLALAAGRALTGDETDEIGRLERRHHDFRLMCTRTAPLNPMALGYRWDERITHVAAPELVARVRAVVLVVVTHVVLLRNGDYMITDLRTLHQTPVFPTPAGPVRCVEMPGAPGPAVV